MPESKRYLVTETTEVEVHAGDEEEALRKANLRFINPTPNEAFFSQPRRISTSVVHKKLGER